MLVLAFLHLALASGAQGKSWKGGSDSSMEDLDMERGIKNRKWVNSCIKFEWSECDPTAKRIGRPCCPGMKCKALDSKYPQRGWCMKKGVEKCVPWSHDCWGCGNRECNVCCEGHKCNV